MRGSHLERWERRTENALTIGALGFLLAYAIPIIWPSVNDATRQVCQIAIIVLWIAFVVDYVLRLFLAENKAVFFRTNLIDFFALALPVLRPLRLLRVLTVVTVFSRVGSRSLRGKMLIYVVGGALLVVVVGALAVIDAERGAPGATITTFGVALWWAINSLMAMWNTVQQPVTVLGEVIMVAIGVTGLALIGAITAAIAAWLVERIDAGDDPDSPATKGEIALLRLELQNLRAELRGSTSSAVEPVPTDSDSKVAGTPSPASAHSAAESEPPEEDDSLVDILREKLA